MHNEISLNGRWQGIGCGSGLFCPLPNASLRRDIGFTKFRRYDWATSSPARLSNTRSDKPRFSLILRNCIAKHYHTLSTYLLQYFQEQGTEKHFQILSLLPSPLIILIAQDIISLADTTSPQNHNTGALAYGIDGSNMHTGHDIPVTYDQSEILTWLSPLEPHLRHHNIRSSRVKDIGDWVLRTEEFRGWRNSDSQGESQKAIIFCSGNLGAGKTYIR